MKILKTQSNVSIHLRCSTYPLLLQEILLAQKLCLLPTIVATNVMSPSVLAIGGSLMTMSKSLDLPSKVRGLILSKSLEVFVCVCTYLEIIIYLLPLVTFVHKGVSFSSCL